MFWCQLYQGHQELYCRQCFEYQTCLSKEKIPMRKIWHKQNYASGIRIHKTNQPCDFTENKPKQNKKRKENFLNSQLFGSSIFIFHKLTTSKDGWSCDIRLKRKRLMSNLGVFGTYWKNINCCSRNFWSGSWRLTRKLIFKNGNEMFKPLNRLITM